jgi:threonine dehydrogenase-like Zn-dependent dehydrogenase
MTDKLTTYRAAAEPLPDHYSLWPLYGQGFATLGVDDQPIDVPMPVFGPDELLVRHDACSICFSDVKVIRAGGAHPRLFNRDLRQEPVVLGHEVALTVVGVGENLRGEFAVGQRYAVQAEIYHHGRNLAYGYMLQGGQSQYSVLGDPVLRGDAGCYLIPIAPDMGYSQAALTEPWACVEAAYNIHYRQSLRPHGIAWFIGSSLHGDPPLTLSRGLEPFGGHPDLVILTDAPPTFAAWLKGRAAELGVEIVERNGLAPADYGAALADIVACGTGSGEGIDDVVILGPARGKLLAAAFCTLARGGVLNIVSDEPLPDRAAIDTGWLHYDHIALVGTRGPDIAAAYGPVRSMLRSGGRLWLLGAAGPMGQMHLQRAIEVGPRPSLIVATNRSSPRIEELQRRFGPAAEKYGIKLVCLTEEALGPEAFQARLWELTDGEGFDDIVILAPSIRSIESGSTLLSSGGALNLFAGLQRGTDAHLDLNPIVDQRQIRIVGSSGSSIADMRHMVVLAEQGVLATNSAVSAVAGLDGFKVGVQAVADGAFPGKVVIYPHIRGLGLTPLADLEQRLPEVHAKLAPGEVWKVEAEEELLRTLL